jgi:hypothetical protein
MDGSVIDAIARVLHAELPSKSDHWRLSLAKRIAAALPAIELEVVAAAGPSAPEPRDVCSLLPAHFTLDRTTRGFKLTNGNTGRSLELSDFDTQSDYACERFLKPALVMLGGGSQFQAPVLR